MADLFTDSDDEKAVEELLSQAMDMAILEQVAAINCAGFKNSLLPSHLETRFQNLKIHPSSLSTQTFDLSHSSNFKKSGYVNKTRNSNHPGEWENVKLTGKNCEGRRKLEPCKKEFPTCLIKCPKETTDANLSFSSRSVNDLSPPAKTGCFLCFPIKVTMKKNNKNRGMYLGKHDEFLSDKMLKKGIKEEEKKICREAEKIVEWVKNASAGIEDELE